MAIRLKPQDLAPAFELPRAGGGVFASEAMSGRHWLLSFQRYST